MDLPKGFTLTSRAIQETRCPECGWESAQPDEMHRADALYHLTKYPQHTVMVTTKTVESIRFIG